MSVGRCSSAFLWTFLSWFTLILLFLEEKSWELVLSFELSFPGSLSRYLLNDDHSLLTAVLNWHLKLVQGGISCLMLQLCIFVCIYIYMFVFLLLYTNCYILQCASTWCQTWFSDLDLSFVLWHGHFLVAVAVVEESSNSGLGFLCVNYGSCWKWDSSHCPQGEAWPWRVGSISSRVRVHGYDCCIPWTSKARCRDNWAH